MSMRALVGGCMMYGVADADMPRQLFNVAPSLRGLLSNKNALKFALKFFRSGKVALSRRDIFKNTTKCIWSGGFPS